MKTSRYAHRLSEIQPFKVMKLLARANELEAQGRPIIHMEVGEPDFPTPAAIVAAGRAAIDGGLTKYTAAEGLPALREKLAEFYQVRYGAEVAASRIFVTAGGSGALLLATALTLNPDEGLLMTDPGYPCNRHFLKSFGACAQLVPVDASVGFQLTPDLVSSYWQKNTRGVLLASPANPTGAVLEPQLMSRLIESVRAKDGHVIVDEIYHGMHYSDEPLDTALKYSDEVIVINSFSKYFGMTGWRLGWMVVPDDAIESVQKLAQNLFICPSSIAQYAALSAFSQEVFDEAERNRKTLMTRRNFLVEQLRQLGFGVSTIPAGAFYIYASIPEGCEDAEPFCAKMLESYNVAITPGTDFGENAAHRHVRFSYAQNIEKLRQGIKNLARGLSNTISN